MKKNKTLSKGIYAVGPKDKIVNLSRVEIYENAQSSDGSFTDTVALVTWEDETGQYPRTLLRSGQFKEFYRIGRL